MTMRITIVDEIIASRNCGVVHCGLSLLKDLGGLASEFGLASDTEKLREIDLVAAQRLLERILHQDMAHESDIMPSERAASLASAFLAEFDDEAQFFTNGTFHEPLGDSKASWACGSWDPLTSATFDTGLLVISSRCSGCLWVEDED